MPLLLTISEVARRTGLGVHTLRYYERAGLIAPVDLDWIGFLLRLRETRMPVARMQAFAPAAPPVPAPAGPDRHRRGLDRLREIDGEAGERVVDGLAGIAPEFARYLVEFPFGDIHSRPGLDLRSREIAVLAALSAPGNAGPQLRVHLRCRAQRGHGARRSWRC